MEPTPLCASAGLIIMTVCNHCRFGCRACFGVATIGYADGAYSSLRKRYSHSIVAGGLPEMS